MARVFISYRRVPPDDAAAMALYRHLANLGHDVFLDSVRVTVGDDWPRTIRGAIEACEWFIALVSSTYLASRNCVDELLVAKPRIARGNVKLLPVSLAFAGSYDERVRALLSDTQAIKWRGPEETPAMVERIAERIPRPTTLVKGMHPFELSDARAFESLCRAQEVEAWLAHVQAYDLSLLHGVSGAGKTSFVRAGLLSQLQAGSHALITAAASARLDWANLVASSRTAIVDQFEQAVVPRCFRSQSWSAWSRRSRRVRRSSTRSSEPSP